MDKELAKKRIEKLKTIIDRHRYLYHVLDKPEMSDAALDSLKNELFYLEQEHPELITPDSPTQRVGGEPLEKFEKVSHVEPMLSLNDAFSGDDIRDWLKRISKLTDERNLDFFCELKVDGLAFELVYKKGFLEVGSTRGDGMVGEKVTENLKTIDSIPLKIREKEETLKDLKKINLDRSLDDLADIIYDQELVVRGEVFISKNDFEKLNKGQKKKGLQEYANPRNVAAGSIRQLDPNIAASRKLDSFTYDLVTDLGATTHEQKHKILKILGFKVNTYDESCKNLEEVFIFYEKIEKIRDSLYYEIDGVIATVNDNKIFKSLGVVGKAPRGSIAYKFPLKEATSVVENIKIQIGRTGVLTPVAHLRPVKIGGVTVTRATLHNRDEIERLDLKIGDTVIVGRAGDVIPDVIKVITEARMGNENKFIFPKKCPSCDSDIEEVKKDATIFRCPNKKCPDRKREHFSYFVSRKGFDFSGLGKRIIDKMIDQGIVSSPADLFFLKKEDLLSLEGFQEKLANNIIEAINQKKKVKLEKLLCALGIENVGEEAALLLKKNFKTLDKIKDASLEELINIKDIGEITANNIHKWFQDRGNVILIERLKESGVEVIKELRIQKNTLEGKRFVLTGSLNSLTRDEAREKVISLGGVVSESVSSGTDFIVVGKDPGSKISKAKKIKVKELKEEDFKEMIKN